MGFQADGAAQEYFAVRSANVLKIPQGISLEHGALIEPAAVAVHALDRARTVLGGGLEGRGVLVLGAGPIGNLVAQTAKAQGARTVLITDLSEFRLQKAKACGIEHTSNPAAEELDGAVARVFGGDRADLIVECVGSETTIGQAIASARKGSAIVVVGVFAEKPMVDLGLVQDRELNLLGTLMYRRADYERAMELMASAAIRVEELITDTFPFERYADAYRHIEQAGERAIKVMIALEGEDTDEH
jgi:L-iditol 2-dehydrogenase